MPGIHIRKKGTIFQECTDPEPEECGIGIDVAIMEDIPDNRILRTLHGLGSMALGLIVSCRRFYRNREYLLRLSDGVPETQKVFRKKIRIGFFLSFLSLSQWMRLYNRWNSLCRNPDSRYVSVPTGRNHYFGELYLREDFYLTAPGLFEGIPVQLPRNYDSYLHHMYGDYHQIPDDSKREQHVVVRWDVP